MSDAGEIVAAGYDAMADRFAAWQGQIGGMTGRDRVEKLLPLLPEEPDVLELGVGAGVAASQVLAERGRLTGVDVSAEQLRRARERLPGATLIHGDFLEVDLPAASFDAVVAVYVLNHVPRDRHGELLRRVAGWLRPGGYFLGSFGAADNPDWRGEWLGVEMFFSGYEPDVTQRLVADAGLVVVVDEIETVQEPEGDVQFLWVLASRGAPAAGRARGR